MAWIYLAESVECQSHCENGLDQSLTAKSTPIVKGSCFLEWQVDTSNMLPSGMTLQPCREGNLRELSTSFSAASLNENDHVRTLALLELEKAWTEREAHLFTKYSDYPDRSAPPSYSWKMSVQLQPEVVWHWSKKLPRWGMIVAGVVYPLRPLELYTKGNDGFYWPTPLASDYRRQDSPCERKRNSPNLTTKLNMMHGTRNQKINLNWLEWLMGYQTGWTELEPWVMQWFRLKRKKRSKF